MWKSSDFVYCTRPSHDTGPVWHHKDYHKPWQRAEQPELQELLEAMLYCLTGVTIVGWTSPDLLEETLQRLEEWFPKKEK